MRSVIAILLFFFNLIQASSSEENNNEILTSNSNIALSSRHSMLRPRNSRTEPSTGVETSPERLCHNFDQFQDSDSDQAITPEMNPIRRSMSGPLSGSFIAGQQSAESSLFPPVSKPNPSTEVPDNDQDFMIENDNLDEEDADTLIAQIPESFIVTETSGKYKSYEDERLFTSADVMKKRSALYRLLSEIYMLFDTFDFEGFRNFLRETPAGVRHQSLRYQLVENLARRALKTKNEDTWQSLARFIEMINDVSVAKTVGKSEHEKFNYFKYRIKSALKKQSALMKVTLGNFLEGETNRLFPLNAAFHSSDYESAKRIIGNSNRNVWISVSDFMILLDRPICDERYTFMKWAIANNHFNVHERYTNELRTPLMIAAMHYKSSTDIVKAILEMSPSSVTDVDDSGSKAVDYAKSNDYLSKNSWKSLVKMLKLENPTVEQIDAILIKYSTDF